MNVRPGPLLIASLSLLYGAGLGVPFLPIDGALPAAPPAALAATPDPVQVTSLGEESAEATLRAPIVEDAPETMEEVYQQQLLQQEVQELRGLVEDLSERVRQMSDRQADRYQDLDRRLEDLRVMVNEVAASQRQAPLTLPGSTPSTTAATTTAARDEKSLYDTALELIRTRQYEAAIAQLKEVINLYPNGAYAPNAYYWLGEVYAALPEPDYEKARQALAQVISYFPDHRKVPDAAFKLGKVYHMMGDCERATELLNQVINQYENKAVANLAESYLRDKVDCAR